MGLSLSRYAMAGALYSLLFLFPYVYLAARMNNRSFPTFVVGLVYFVLFIVIWMGGALSMNYLFWKGELLDSTVSNTL